MTNAHYFLILFLVVIFLLTIVSLISVSTVFKNYKFIKLINTQLIMI